MRCLMLLALLIVATEARSDLVGGVNVLASWNRQAGAHSDIENPERGKVKTIDPYQLSKRLKVRKLYDVQYGEARYVKSVPLTALVDAAARSSDADLVILHFENGMQVPLKRDALAHLGAYLAVEACNAKGRACEPAFEDVGDDDDPRPVVFTWNKLVVGKSARGKGFSPWHHTDTLKGIELADDAAYRAQLEIGEPRGLAVYEARCQVCHGARQVGARFGWDFVTPLPLHEKRPPENLLNHVKYPKVMARRLGLQMPNQPDVTLGEIEQLWRWMRAAAKKPLGRYLPTANVRP